MPRTDAVGAFLNSAAKYPIPTKAQQITYAQQIQRGRQHDATPRERRIGLKARDRMVSGNLRLVWPVARKMARAIERSAAIDIEDLLQAGVIGLHRAAELFDPTRGYAFSTYAFNWIRHAIQKEIEINRATIRQPNSVQELLRRWRYRPEGQSVEDFAEAWGYTAEKVMAELQQGAITASVSLQVCAHGDDTSELGELLPAPSLTDAEVDDQALMRDVIEHLRQVLPDDLAAMELQQDGASRTEVLRLLGYRANGSGISYHWAGLRERLQAAMPAEALQLLEVA
jgi:RNA polymerase sigma factor (sigma-70 family)